MIFCFEKQVRTYDVFSDGTWQLAIWPSREDYCNLRFLWRLSYTMVDSSGIRFDPLSGYKRMIYALGGNLSLHLQNGRQVGLMPRSGYSFKDGDLPAKATGKCLVYNLLLREGQADGFMWSLALSSQGSLCSGKSVGSPNRHGEFITAYSCVDGFFKAAIHANPTVGHIKPINVCTNETLLFGRDRADPALQLQWSSDTEILFAHIEFY